MMLDVKSFQLQSFLPLPYEEVLAPRLKRAHEKLQSGSGAGGEPLIYRLGPSAPGL